MKKLLKNIFIFCVILIFLYAFSSSYSSHNIDNLAYVIAMGIDTGENGKIKVSFQFTDTSTFSESGSSDDSSIIMDSAEASSIDSAINLINSYVGKEINLAHCKAIIFSESIAKSGIQDYVLGLINNSQVRPTANIIISRCDAKDYIENSSSNYEKILTKYYEVFPKSADYTGYTANITIGEFFNELTSSTSNPVAILGGVNSEEAGDSSIEGERSSENIGLAVFKDGTLVGELTAIETLCHSITLNSVSTFLVSIPDPENSKSNLDLSMSLYEKTKTEIDTSSASPYIKINLDLDARILTMSENTDYLAEDYLNSIADSAEKYLDEQMLAYLYKTSTEFNSCIDNFDKTATHNFLTTEEWNNYNWNSCYNSAFFEVNSNVNVDSSLLLTES